MFFKTKSSAQHIAFILINFFVIFLFLLNVFNCNIAWKWSKRQVALNIKAAHIALHTIKHKTKALGLGPVLDMSVKKIFVTLDTLPKNNIVDSVKHDEPGFLSLAGVDCHSHAVI